MSAPRRRKGEGGGEAAQQGGASAATMVRGGGIMDPATLVLLAVSAAFGAVLVRYVAPVFLAPPDPVVYSYRVVRKYNHDPRSFTQGLLWLDGALYESAGLYGQSLIREVRLTEDGKSEVVREVKLKRSQFAEGLTHWNNELLMLLWKKPDVIRIDARAGPEGHLKIKEQRSKTPLSDGWGLTSGHGVLFATDSGPDVHHLHPDTFELQKTVRVEDAGHPVEMINELEMVDGELWGNVFGNECIVRVDPSSGAVRGWIDLTGILDWRRATADAGVAGRPPPDVMNGIAWDPDTRRLFVTGKLWPELFEIEVVPHPTLTLDEARERCIPRRNVFRV